MLQTLNRFSLVIFIVSLLGLWLSAQLGVFLRPKFAPRSAF
jgi:hypothetical protein